MVYDHAIATLLRARAHQQKVSYTCVGWRRLTDTNMTDKAGPQKLGRYGVNRCVTSGCANNTPTSPRKRLKARHVAHYALQPPQKVRQIRRTPAMRAEGRERCLAWARALVRRVRGWNASWQLIFLVFTSKGSYFASETALILAKSVDERTIDTHCCICLHACHAEGVSRRARGS